MENRIVFQTNDGTVAVIIPVSGESILDIAKRDVPKGLPFKIVNESIVPTERTFRSAWELGQFIPDGYGLGKDSEETESTLMEITPSSEPLISVNMQKAIEIKKDILRRQRVALFEQLDVEFMKSIENADSLKQSQIVQKKQLLRDVTEHESIINAKTPEELINADPIANIM
jgi:hypothetical protein